MQTKRRVDFEYNRNDDKYQDDSNEYEKCDEDEGIKSMVRMKKMKMMAKMLSKKTVMKVSKMKTEVKIKIKKLVKTRARTNFEYK